MIKSLYQHISTDAARALQYQQVWRFSCSILIGVVMVKMGWAKEKVAIFELLFFTAHILSFAWSVGIKNALLTIYPSTIEADKPKFLFNVAILLFGVSILIGVTFYTFHESIFALLAGDPALPYALWLTIFLICTPVTILVEMTYLLIGLPHKIVKYTHFIYPVQVVLTLIAIIGFDSVRLLVVAMAIWSLIKFVWLIIVLIKHSKWQLEIKSISRFWWFALPLVIQFMVTNGMDYMDGIIVNHFFATDQFPVFRYGAKELPINTILVVALSSAMVPLAVSNMKASLVEIKARTHGLMKYLFPLSAVLILCAPIIYKAVYSEEYMQSAFIFSVYLLILLSRILLPQVIMLASKRNNALLIVTVIELAVNVGLSIWWARAFGLIGVAYATLVANIIHAMLMLAYCKWKLHISPGQYIPVRSYLGYSFMLLGAYILSIYIY